MIRFTGSSCLSAWQEGFVPNLGAHASLLAGFTRQSPLTKMLLLVSSLISTAFLPSASFSLAPGLHRLPTLPLLVSRASLERCAPASMQASRVARSLVLRGGSVAAGNTAVAARLMGWALTAAAVTLYVPMIAELVRNKKAPESMSATTWSLQLTGFALTVVFHVRMGFPLSTYADFAALGVQSLVILVLSMVYRKKASPLAALPVVGLVAALIAPLKGLKALQAASAVVTTWALLPQIVSNFRSRSRGGWSATAAALSTVGNAGRLFTTVTLADGNVLLLAQFAVAMLMNGCLMVQSLVWDDAE